LDSKRNDMPSFLNKRLPFFVYPVDDVFHVYIG